MKVPELLHAYEELTPQEKMEFIEDNIAELFQLLNIDISRMLNEIETSDIASVLKVFHGVQLIDLLDKFSDEDSIRDLLEDMKADEEYQEYYEGDDFPY